MKRWFPVIGLVLALAARPSHAAVVSSSIPEKLRVVIEDLIDSQYTAEAHETELVPQNPAPGEMVKVRAVIKNDPYQTSRVPLQAWLAYRVGDEGPLEQVEMTAADGDWWEVDIGPFEEGDTVYYGFQAMDSGENMYLETPCFVTAEWPPFGDPCLQPAAVDVDVDDSESSVQAEMDILETWYGESEDELFFEMVAQGKITEGTVNPPNIYARVLGVLNMDVAQNDLLQGYLPFYAPLARLVQEEPCTTLYNRGGEPATDNQFVRCAPVDNRLMFGMKKSFYRKNPGNLMKFAMATGIMINLDPIDGLPKDYTQVTTVRRVGRSFTVE